MLHGRIHPMCYHNQIKAEGDFIHVTTSVNWGFPQRLAGRGATLGQHLSDFRNTRLGAFPQVEALTGPQHLHVSLRVSPLVQLANQVVVKWLNIQTALFLQRISEKKKRISEKKKEYLKKTKNIWKKKRISEKKKNIWKKKRISEKK